MVTNTHVLPRAASWALALSLLSFVVICISMAGVVPMVALAQTATAKDCSTIRALTDLLPAGYGSPLDLSSSIASKPMLTVTCDTVGGVRAHADNDQPETYIYQYGYQRVHGVWKPFTFTGAVTNGPWVLQHAEAVLPDQSSSGKIIAYTCTRVNGVWKCGCRDAVCTQAYWQVQTYDASKSTVTTFSGLDISSLLVTSPSGDPGVYQLSNYMALPGETLTISGAGFSKTNNEVKFGKSVSVKGVPSLFGTSLSVTVPTTLASGKYTVTVRADGKELDGSGVLWVKDDDARKPQIFTVTPEIGAQGDTFTLFGQGFSRSYNDIVTTFGVIEGVKSENTVTLSFKYDPFDEEVVFRNMDGTKANYQQEITIQVITSGGTSDQKKFLLKM